MPQDAQELWTQLQQAITGGEAAWGSAFRLTLSLVMGGAAAAYVQFLYRVIARPTSSDSISRVFPLLTLVTVAVIAVVKSSLALSLGLVGALSIVRFRAAIKDPEELVYLFLCIGVGLALGADQPILAAALLLVATGFAVVLQRVRPGARRGDGYLTIVGSASRWFGADESGIATIVRGAFPCLTIERCDVQGDQGQLRARVHRVDPRRLTEALTRLRERLPGCDISYASAEATLA